MKNNLMSSLGLCKRAGKLICGTDAVCTAIREQKNVLLVLAASDVSENTAKKITDKTSYYKVPLRVLEQTCYELGRAVGRMGGNACVGITDQSFVRLIEEHID